SSRRRHTRSKRDWSSDVCSSDLNEDKTVIRTGVGLFYSLLPLLAGDFAANPTQVITPFDTAGLQSGLPVTYTNVYVGGSNPLTRSEERRVGKESRCRRASVRCTK